MKQRDRWRKRKAKSQLAASEPAPSGSIESAHRGWLSDPRLWLLAAAVASGLFLAYTFWNNPEEAGPLTPIAQNRGRPVGENHDLDPGDFHGKKPAAKAVDGNTSDSFLDEFNNDKTEAEKDGSGIAWSSDKLEKQFQTLVVLNDEISDLKKRGSTIGGFAKEAEAMQALARLESMTNEFDRLSAALEKEVGQATKARPGDPVPRWLTGELLIIIGGEPEEINPHLQFALERGLKRPRLSGSVARSRLEANQFAESYRTAAAALDENSQDRYVWNAFARSAISNNKFDHVLERLGRVFPNGPPGWALAYRREAEELQVRWEAEQKLRQAEWLADDLPRVRLVIEHRRFGKDASEKPLTTIESTGREEVVVELFENEAPITVANFIDLVARKFYDGTSFHLAVPGTMVVGGDPNTRNDDPSDDGAGGPGYVIPDEYQAKTARSHFRGSLSMVKTKPHTAGSQFFFGLSPLPQMNGNYTTFGRVIKGQEAVDRITRGRTTRDLGHFGKIIPGDLLVRAEVLRKRPHEYRATKE